MDSSRPEASANSASSTPRQRQLKPRAASSPGQPRPVGKCVFWPAGHVGLVLHIGATYGWVHAFRDDPMFVTGLWDTTASYLKARNISQVSHHTSK